MSTNKAAIAIDARVPSSNPLDIIPNEIPFDVPYGRPISLERAQTVIQAAVAEAKKRNWKMNIAVADSAGNLVAFQRMDGAMLASIQIAEHKARAAVTFRRPTKIFEALYLCTLHQCNESELKCEDNRDNVGTNRKAQQAPARLTSAMSPSKQYPR